MTHIPEILPEHPPERQDEAPITAEMQEVLDRRAEEASKVRQASRDKRMELIQAMRREGMAA